MQIFKGLSTQAYWSYRTVVFMTGVCLAFFVPWWVSATFSGSILLRFGWNEYLAIGLLLDALYLTYDVSMIGMHLFTGSFIVLAVVSWFMRRRLRSMA